MYMFALFAPGDQQSSVFAATMGEEGVIAGSAVAVGLTVYMCVCGIPMIFAGVVLIIIYNSAEEFDKDDM